VVLTTSDRTPSNAYRVDDEGIHLPDRGVADDAVVDVLLEGRRIWSFKADRDRRMNGVVPWPPALREHLNGLATWSLWAHGTERELASGESLLGSGEGTVRVIDSDGRPLAVAKGGNLLVMLADSGGRDREALADALVAVLADLRGPGAAEAFLSFGCLLGAVRDGHVIGHDTDADVTVLSPSSYPADVALQSFRLERTMRDRGWHTARQTSGSFKVWVAKQDGGRMGIDVFGSWFIGDVMYVLPNQRVELARSALVPVSTVTLEGRPMPGPADPEALLAATYGPGWRVPDPSFSFAFKDQGPAIRRLRGWLRGERLDRLAWDEWFSGEGGSDPSPPPSGFAQWVRPQLDPARQLLDVGCGNGRDAVWFAGDGLDVVGLDYSVTGLEAAARMAEHAGVAMRLDYLNLYDPRQTMARAARFAFERAPRDVYTRFLVDCLGSQGRRDLLVMCRMVQRHGGSVFAEFRAAGRDGSRPQLPEHFAREVERAGGVVEHREQGTGLAAGDDDNDLQICRMRIGWRN